MGHHLKSVINRKGKWIDVSVIERRRIVSIMDWIAYYGILFDTKERAVDWLYEKHRVEFIEYMLGIMG